jgi:DNA-binding CsgD family transcriptional regulator
MTIQRTRFLDHLQQSRIAVIDALYAAVTDPARWSEVIRASTDLVGGGVSTVLYRSGPRLMKHRLLATELDPASAESYEEHYAAINPWVLYQREDRPLLEARESMLSSPLQLEHSEFYVDWLRPKDLRYSFNACVPLDTGDTIELTSVRSVRLGPYDQAEHEVLESLLPHLRRAVQLSNRLRITEAGLAASSLVSRKAGAGVVLVGSDQRVVYMDALAEEFLRHGNLTVRDGRLTTRPPQDSVLSKAITAATGAGRRVVGRTGAMMTIRQSCDRVLSVAISPLDERDRPPGHIGLLALVLVSAPGQSTGPDESRLRRLLDLTPAEARLVRALCDGQTLASYADCTGTSLNTVKTHLKHVFEKTGETRQADLIRRVSTDMAVRLHP